MDSNLLVICGTAFTSVFIVLIALAIVMRIIIAAFPHIEKETGTDAATLAAISTTYQAIYPGTNITKIEEIK